MAKTSEQQARDLAETFRDLSVKLGDYRFANWGTLTSQQRKDIEDTEWTLLNHSSDFITTAVGIQLNKLQDDLKQIDKATKKATQAIKTATTVRNVLKVAAALVILAGAVASKDPQAIVTASKDLYDTSKPIVDNA